MHDLRVPSRVIGTAQLDWKVGGKVEINKGRGRGCKCGGGSIGAAGEFCGRQFECLLGKKGSWYHIEDNLLMYFINQDSVTA